MQQFKKQEMCHVPPLALSLSSCGVYYFIVPVYCHATLAKGVPLPFYTLAA
jgi:hypothetical protein